MICWKFRREIAKIWRIETFIYIFWVICVWGIPLTSAHAQKFKNKNIRNFGFYIELFHTLKHFKRLSFIFTSILSQSYEKIAAMSNSIEWRYETDTCSVSHGKSHGSCNVKYLLPVNASSVLIVNKIRKKRPLPAYFDENTAQLKQKNHINYLQIFFR